MNEKIIDSIKEKANKDLEVLNSLTEANYQDLLNYSRFKHLLSYPESLKQLVFDNIQEVLAKSRGDFFEYCRFKCLQLELLLDMFLLNSYPSNKKDNDKRFLKQRYNFFVNKINDEQINESKKQEWGTIIFPLIEIRNIASHRDNVGNLESRIEKRINSFHLSVSELRPSVNDEEKLETDISKSLNKSNSWEQVFTTFKLNQKPAYGYAFIDLYEVDTIQHFAKQLGTIGGRELGQKL